MYGSLAYNQRKVDDEKAKVLLTNKMFHPANGEFNVADCMRDFNNFIPKGVRSKNPVIHVSLNPHPDDRLSDEQMGAIAEEYLERMGYGDQPYIIYKHEDIARHHLHIVSLRIKEDGSKISDKFEYLRSKKITQDLEQKYGLNRAEKGEKKELGECARVDPSRGDLEQQIGSVLSGVSKYHYLSLSEYRALLSLYNVTAEEVKGSERGQKYCGLVYSATNDLGEKIGTPISSHSFGKEFGYAALEAHYARSKSTLKRTNIGAKTKSHVSDALHRSVDREQFREELSRRGIDVVFRENDAGRLYGVTYIDHTNHCVLNGSRLGKELSANAISEWFKNPHPTIAPREEQHEHEHENEHGYRHGGHEDHSPRQPFEPLNEEQSQSRDDNDESLSFGSLFDLPFDSGGYDDSEDENIANAIQRRKKKRKHNYKL